MPAAFDILHRRQTAGRFPTKAVVEIEIGMLSPILNSKRLAFSPIRLHVTTRVNFSPGRNRELIYRVIGVRVGFDSRPARDLSLHPVVRPREVTFQAQLTGHAAFGPALLEQGDNRLLLHLELIHRLGSSTQGTSKATAHLNSRTSG